MKKTIILLSCSLLIFNSLFCQIGINEGCGMTDPESGGSMNAPTSISCRLAGLSHDFDIPYEPQPEYPSTIIRLNLIFLQRDNGTGNFQQHNPVDDAFWDQTISHLNYIYSHLSNPNDSSCYTSSDFISDAKIQFVINKIYIKNEHEWNSRNAGCSTSSYFPISIDNEIINNPSIPRGINIYFNEDSINYVNLVANRSTNEWTACTAFDYSQFPNFYDLNASSKVMIRNMYSARWYWNNIMMLPLNDQTTSLAKGLAHELGHSLNLYHNCPYYETNTCYYSIMHQAGASYRTYLPPPEIGRIHASLSLSNLRAFVPKETYNPYPLEINSDKTWNYEIRSYRDITIQSGNTLTISCKLIMPYQGSINVNNSSKFIINNGQIESITSSPWKGITVKNGGYLELNAASIINYKIEVESGGTLRLIGNINLTGTSSIDIKLGGYICFDNTATINLQDPFCVINLHNGYNLGVNTTYITNPGICLSNISSITKTGNGSINLYNSTIYIQNEIISTDKYYAGYDILAGSNVTTANPPGPGKVQIKSGKNIILDAERNVILDKDFEIESGASMEIK